MYYGRHNRTTNHEPRTTNHEPTFCTLFNISNEHLTKDVGLIPYGMHEFEGYDSFMATYINGDYPNLKYTPGLRIEEVPNITGNYDEDSCIWLEKNAKRIDVLNLYHFCERSFNHIKVYKRNNPRGKVYLKMDGCAYPPARRRRFWKNIKPWLMMMLCKCASTEFHENAEILSHAWKRKIICVPNPFNPNELRDFRQFSERENTIFYTGRIEAEKGSNTLLEAFAQISASLPNWSLKLTGELREGIKEKFEAKYPDLKERVIFTGEIRDRNTLVEMYRDAKIFAFPSRRESFGISLTEAMMQGDFAVTTDIPSSRILTENFRFALGSDVDDIDGLANNLLYACTHEHEIEKLAIEGRNATIERCDLKRICSVIADGLKS